MGCSKGGDTISKAIQLLITSDFHANFDCYDQLNKGLLTLENPSHYDSIKLDLGDFLQGSEDAYFYNRIVANPEKITAAMNQLNYDYQVIGNHEFNYGIDYLATVIEQLDATVLNANIVDKVSLAPVAGKPYDIIDFQGFKIGIIGLTTPRIASWENSEHITGTTFVDPLDALNNYYETLTKACDMLIVAYHGGIEFDLDTLAYNDRTPGENQAGALLQQFPKIDLLLTSHQHLQFTKQIQDTWVMQSGSHGTAIGEVIIEYDGSTINRITPRIHLLTPLEEPTTISDPILPKMLDSLAWKKEVIGNVPSKRSLPVSQLEASIYGHPFYELLNRIQMKESQSDFALIAIPNEQFNCFEGIMTNERLYQCFPYYNYIATLNLTGAELYQFMTYNLACFTLSENKELKFNLDFQTDRAHHFYFHHFSGFSCFSSLNENNRLTVDSLIDQRTNQPINLTQHYKIAMPVHHAFNKDGFENIRHQTTLDITNKDTFQLMAETIQAFDAADWQDLHAKYGNLILRTPIDLAKQPYL